HSGSGRPLPAPARGRGRQRADRHRARPGAGVRPGTPGHRAMNAEAGIIATPDTSWDVRNQRWLVAQLARLRERIEGGTDADAVLASVDDTGLVPALQHCAELFGLSGFERDVLLLCAGVALDATFARSVAQACGRADGQPTFPFALAL